MCVAVTVVRICEYVEEQGGRLSELVTLLAIATQPGHFNKHPQRRQSRRRDLMAKEIRGSRTRIKNVRRRDSGEDLRICRGAGRMTLRVGGSAGKGNTTWSFQQIPPTAAIPKARSNGEG